MFLTTNITHAVDRRGSETAASCRVRPGSFALWRRPRSLRARLVAIVLVADALAALLTGAVIVWKARIATKLEIASAMQLGQTLVADTIRLMQDSPAPLLLQSIDLHFQSVRHVRITVFDADGRPVEAAASADPGSVEPPTASPAWFTALVAPPVETKDFPILVHNHAIGQVALTSQPSDEVGEAWIYAKAVLITAACLNVVVLIALVLAFGRILAPLEAFADGLKGLESRNYAIRLPSSSIRELSTITDHFNRTAAPLLASEADNPRLNRQLLTAQDDERRRTSLELHDEVGPCLFALEANATSIVVMAGAPASPDLRHIRARAADVVSLVERVQGINRRVLDRLRPMALGRIPLYESLIKLVVDLEIDGSTAHLDSDIGPLRKSYGFAVDLTVYRCVQEGLFNAIRHADADRIHLRVQEDPAADAPHLVVEVVDDGIGLKDGVKSGRGLAGIRERVEALTGVFSIESSPNGTRIEITIPVDPSADTDPSSTNETSAT